MPANLTDVDAFTSPIVIPADGDDIDQAVHEPAYQGLANRTRNLLNKLLGLTNGEFLYTTSGTPTVRSKSIFVDMSRGQPTNGSGPHSCTYDSLVGWSMGSSDDAVSVSIDLPPGVTITGLEFGFDNQGGDGSGAVGVRVRRVTPNTSTGVNARSAGLLIQNTTPSLFGDGVAGNLAVSAAIDAVSRLELNVEAGVGDGASLHGICAWVKLTYNDPGPRNGV